MQMFAAYYISLIKAAAVLIYDAGKCMLEIPAKHVRTRTLRGGYEDYKISLATIVPVGCSNAKMIIVTYV